MESDLVLKNAIKTLEGHPRYGYIIDSYFRRLTPSIGDSLEIRYENVLASINELWLDSEKNPSIFKDTKDFESILQENKYYRDHFIHSFNVFLLGYYIINKLKEEFPNENSLRIVAGNHSNLTWMLASTFHDVAYPIQETEYWLSSLFEKFLGVNPNFSFGIGQVLPSIYTDFMKMLSKYHRSPGQGILDSSDLLSVDWSFYNELCSGLAQKNHGVLGALMLCHRMAVREKFLLQDSNQINPRTPWDFLIDHMPACHAISVHALDSVPISFRKYPFAYLLVLCDEIQDWGRPSRKKKQDVICLKSIEISGTRLPNINFEIEASPKRRTRLLKTINKRLIRDDSINLTIA
jgi:hypothetical protein